MKWVLIFHAINIERKIISEEGIGSLLRVNNKGGMMRGFNPLKFVPLGIVSVET